MKFMGGLHPKAQGYCKAWKKLQDIVNTYCEDIAIKVIEPSEAADSAVRKNTSLIIQVEKKELLEKFLDKYSDYFKDDALDSYNFNRTGFNGLGKQFNNLLGQLKRTTDTNKVLKDCFIDDTKFLPIILWGLRKNCIGFKDIRFSLAPKEEQLDKIPKIELRKRKLRNNDSDNDIIDFCITLDLSKFKIARNVENIEEIEPRTEQTKIEYPEWKIFLCINLSINNNESRLAICTKPACIFTNYGVDINSTFRKNRSHLNSKIRQILKTEEKTRYLVEHNKKDESKFDIDMALYQEFLNELNLENYPSLSNSFKKAKKRFKEEELANYQRFTNRINNDSNI